MAVFKKRRSREMIWGQDGKVREDNEIPKPEVILGPAGDSNMNSNIANENSMGFLGTMATAASSGADLSNSSPAIEEKPKSSPYGWEPSSSSTDFSSSESSSSSYSSDSDAHDKIFRLQRKIDNLVERIEELERKMRSY
jgi:hypothetical protein